MRARPEYDETAEYGEIARQFQSDEPRLTTLDWQATRPLRVFRSQTAALTSRLVKYTRPLGSPL